MWLTELVVLPGMAWHDETAHEIIPSSRAMDNQDYLANMALSNACILGYDPGGDGKHGVAVLHLRDRAPIKIETLTLPNTEAVIEYFSTVENVHALGVDTLTCWSTGPGGWRPADRWLRKMYPQVAPSIVTPNGLFGSMGLNGPSVVLECQAVNPALIVTEAHPKVLHWHLARKRYDYAGEKGRMLDLLSGLLQVSVEATTDHAWDAALSAFAAFRGCYGDWDNDLHQLPVEANERIVWPCGATRYFWP
jgi:hypothetical protein